MQLILKKMVVENFKGIKALEISFNDGRTDIQGENGTGKSSIVDAFCWALFDKDAHGNAPGSSFQAKPLGEDNKEIHNLTTAVELDCELDGAPYCLRREQTEKWTKPRCKTEQVFGGNVSSYAFNGVPMRLTDFKSKVAQIAKEDLFRMLGTLGAFNALKWQERRAHLLALSDVDVDAEIQALPKFAPLVQEAGKRGNTLDELRKALDAERKRINKELETLPIRIDEAKKSLPEISEHALADAEYVVKTTREDLAHVDGLIVKARAEDPAQKRQELQAALDHAKKAAEDAAHAKYSAENTKLTNNKVWCNRLTVELDRLQKSAETLSGKLESHKNNRDSLRRQYAENRVKVFDPEANTICPCCGQTIPEDQRRAAFLAQKKQEADHISMLGKECAARINDLIAAIDSKTVEIEETQKTLEEAQENVRLCVVALEAIKPEITEEQQRLEAELAAFDGGDDAAKQKEISDLEARRKELEDTIGRNQQIILRVRAAEETKGRIRQLEEQQRQYADQIGNVENLQVLSEEYTAERCNRLTAAINAKFPTVRWKLFDTQINGGIADTCVCMIPVDGALVDYSSANTAAQVNADIEVINTLSTACGVSVPLFVDNAERVNDLAAGCGQMITLSVSTDKELQIS